MEYRKVENGDVWEVYLEGKFVFSDKDKFRPVCFAFGDNSVKAIILDFSSLEFLDSTAIGMLLVLSDNADKAGGKVIVRNLRGQPQVLFEKSELGSIFDIE